MSSDSDEDELLQMALKEQAERDTTYSKSKPSKPVVNLIQPPPPPPQMRNNKPNNNPRRGMSRDDDEDSEVEMLSISSGDEDDSSRELPKATSKAATSSSNNRARRASKDYGEEDDGEEPRSWKRVDEAELARRVREMRETRASPAAQTIDPKAALGRKGLTNLQSLPRGVEVLDPLGLGVIDNKSLRLITDASVSSPAHRDKPETLDPSIREKVIYSSPNFDAKVFLSRVHQETKAADLESAALTLKADLKGRTQEKKKLVKENFDCFISCKNTIDDIESKLRQIEEDPEGAGTAHLHAATEKISEIANRAFQPLFERQVQAEKIRSVQGMLQRFRTLFNLPSAIKGSICKGEYDLAVREYRKARSIVLPSHVGILKRVLEEVEKVMNEFRGMLYKSMEDPQLDLAELENTVRLLLELEPDSDPVWHYLDIQNRRVRGLLEKCTAEHETRMELLRSEMQERMQSDARWRQLQQESNKSLDVDSSMQDCGDTMVSNGQEVDALRGRYIHRLTSVLVQHVPAFWRLTLSVFSGKFAKVTGGNVPLDSEINAKSGQSKTEDKSGDMKYSSHSLEEVAEMVQGTISAYEIKVHNTFRDFEGSNIIYPYMSNAAKETEKACLALEGNESAPTIAVKSLHALHFEITRIHIQRLCSWMRATTEEISKEEIWIPLSTLERNKSPYAISYLPLAFQAMIMSAMNQIDLMIQNLRNKVVKLENMYEQLQETQESVKFAFFNCFMEFIGYLEQIGAELSESRPANMQNGYMSGFENEQTGVHSDSGVDDSQKKLLIVLSNIGYCKDELCQELYNKFKHMWLQDMERDEEYADIKELISKFSALEEKILENYTYAKSNLIRAAASNYLLDSGVQWGSAPAVKGIRDATLELLHCLVAVHAEVFAGAKPLLEKILGILVEGLMDTFLSLFHEHKSKYLKSFDTNGFCQLMLELEFFETVLNAYFSPEARESLKSLQGLLLEKACESSVEPIENPGHNRRPTRGSEDAMADDRQQVTPDDLLALANQYCSEILESELERTRLNIVCFVESSLQPSSVPSSFRPAAYSSSSYQGSATSSPNYRRQQTQTQTQTVGSPVYSRRRRL